MVRNLLLNSNNFFSGRHKKFTLISQVVNQFCIFYRSAFKFVDTTDVSVSIANIVCKHDISKTALNVQIPADRVHHRPPHALLSRVSITVMCEHTWKCSIHKTEIGAMGTVLCCRRSLTVSDGASSQ